MEEADKVKTEFDFSNKKILIVEDIDSNYMLLHEFLKPTNANIIWAENGATALELCKEHKDLDLILMDIQLPDMTGFHVTKIIREFNKTLPIVAQTAFAMSGDKDTCIEAGCNDYIAKPISRLAFLAIIAKYI